MLNWIIWYRTAFDIETTYKNCIWHRNYIELYELELFD